MAKSEICLGNINYCNNLKEAGRNPRFLLYNKKMEKLIIIEAPHFFAGAFVRDGKVYNAAPIIRWMIGKDMDYIKSYCDKKNWTMV